MTAAVNVRVNSRAIPTLNPQPTSTTTMTNLEVKEATRYDSKTVTVITKADKKIVITKYANATTDMPVYAIANNAYRQGDLFFPEVEKLYNDGLSLLLNKDPHTMLYVRALELAIEKDDTTIVESMLRIDFTEIQKIALLEVLRAAGNPDSFQTLKEHLQ